MKLTKKQIIGEIVPLIKGIILGIFILAIPMAIHVDLLPSRWDGIEKLWLILSAPIAAATYSIVDWYGIPLLIPYIFDLIFRKTVKQSVNRLLAIIFVSLSVYFLAFLWIFSCQVEMNTGIYKTKHQVCYGYQTGIIDGASYESYRVKGADYKTFEELENGYAKDNNKVHYLFGNKCIFDCVPKIYGAEKIKADPETFEVLDGKYAKDQYNAYYAGNKIDLDIDIPTFETVDENYAKDKNNVYTWISPVSEDEFRIVEISKADPESFEIVHSVFTKDKNHVYNGININDSFDSDSFESEVFGVFRDINGTYFCKNQIGPFGENNYYVCSENREVPQNF